MKKNGWEAFFDGHAPQYMDNVFTKNTVQEVDFLLEELHLKQGGHILDMGCGTGRHAVELARRGFRMTGVDLSSGMLAEARKAADMAGVTVEWIHADATAFTADSAFDAAICLCEGAFGLLGKEGNAIEQPLSILKNIHAALKTGARAVFTVLNGFRLIRKHQQDDVKNGRFDPLTLSEMFTEEFDTPEDRKSVYLRERGFVPTELVLLFRQAGLDVEHIWGGTAGNWGRRPIDLDEYEIMVIAKKTRQA